MIIVGVFDLGNSSDAFLVLRAQERGLSVVGVLGMLVTFNAVYTLVSAPAGDLSDRIGRKPIILAGCLIAALTYFPLFKGLTSLINPQLEIALEKVKVEVTDLGTKQPITDYVSRVFQVEGGGNYDIRTVFQVGSSVVALHYAGSERPSRNLMSDVEETILTRVSPDDFGDTSTTVAGVTPLPPQSTNKLDDGKLEKAPANETDDGIPPPTTVG